MPRSQAASLLERLQALNPDDLVAVLGVAVTREEGGKHKIHCFINGSDMELAEMFAHLAKTTRKAVMETHASSLQKNEDLQ